VSSGYVKLHGKKKGEYVEEMARKILEGLHFSQSTVLEISSKEKFDACRSGNEEKAPELLFETFGFLKIFGG
jgi:hypothetical protein